MKKKRSRPFSSHRRSSSWDEFEEHLTTAESGYKTNPSDQTLAAWETALQAVKIYLDNEAKDFDNDRFYSSNLFPKDREFYQEQHEKHKNTYNASRIAYNLNASKINEQFQKSVPLIHVEAEMTRSSDPISSDHENLQNPLLRTDSEENTSSWSRLFRCCCPRGKKQEEVNLNFDSEEQATKKSGYKPPSL